MASWYEETIREEDRYLVAKAQLELNIVRKYLCQVLQPIIDRIKGGS